MFAKKHESRFASYLSSGEFLLNAGKGIETVRDSFPGQSGDSYIGVTNQNVHVVYEDGNSCTRKLSDVELVEIRRVLTIVPRVRELRVSSIDGMIPPIVFHGGKQLANELALLIRIQRLDSGANQQPRLEPFDASEWLKAGLTGGMLARGRTLEYLNGYVAQRDSAGEGLFKFIPLMSTTIDMCVNAGESFARELESVWLRELDGHLKAIQITMDLSRIHEQWNPFSVNEIERLVSLTKGARRELVLSWYQLKHDLLEGSFRAAWSLIKANELECAEYVLKLGITLSEGSEHLVLRS